ncbi:hypothetical protein [Dysgonomonas termitidis]|uniref:Uncharacterized protein n=1 Tax=Dysgonomonas termitidis TaxID=1516126 RepID=A0ABV9KUA5_9BACT
MKSIVTIEMTLHYKEIPGIIKRLQYVEYTVNVDGKEVCHIKSAPDVWVKSNHPLREFELWLLGEQAEGGSTGNMQIDHKAIEQISQYYALDYKILRDMLGWKKAMRLFLRAKYNSLSGHIYKRRNNILHLNIFFHHFFKK